MHKVQFKKQKYGIVFHHLHNKKKYKKSKGSISAIDLEKIINKIGTENILTPKSFLKSPQKNYKNKVCLTFDDGLRCQYDIALPVLNKYDIKAFFFIFTKSLVPTSITIEVIRYFRENYFKNINVFYKTFLDEVGILKKIKLKTFFANNQEEFKKIKENSPYYTKKDIQFRMVRDSFLTEDEYLKIIKILFKRKKFNYTSISSKLYMNEKHLRLLNLKGHEIGLHSHSHSSGIKYFSAKEEFNDYYLNKKILKKLPIKKINTSSYPFGVITKNTYNIMKKLKIKYSFLKNFNANLFGNLKIPRENHSTILKKIK